MKKILFEFFLWFRENGEKHINKSIEKMIDIYLEESDNDFITTKELVNDCEKAFENLKHKQFDWKCFYNGWLECFAKYLI